jgi:hypothetical protein
MSELSSDKSKEPRKSQGSRIKKTNAVTFSSKGNKDDTQSSNTTRSCMQESKIENQTYIARNQELVLRIAQLEKSLSVKEKWISDLWIQHVKDRLRQRKVWDHGWSQGYLHCKNHLLAPLVDQMNSVIDNLNTTLQLSDEASLQLDMAKYGEDIYSQKWMTIKIPDQITQLHSRQKLASVIQTLTDKMITKNEIDSIIEVIPFKSRSHT